MKEILEKLARGARLDVRDCERLLGSRDLHALGAAAEAAKRRRHGNRAYYIVNRHINYTNLCALACEVCSFGKRTGDAGVYERTVEQVAREAAEAQAAGACEVHVTGACHPHWRIERYEAMVRAIRDAAPRVHVKAFTAVEVEHVARLSGISVEDALRRLIDAGLGSMPGGGAEIFDPAVRGRLFPGKLGGREWLDVHRTAHRLGLRTNATMLYGHMESHAHRAAHLLALRELQDETGGFQAFVPLSFVPPPVFRGNADVSSACPAGILPASVISDQDQQLRQKRRNGEDAARTGARYPHADKMSTTRSDTGKMPVAHMGETPMPRSTTGLDDLVTLAASRLMLDNFDHIKTFWVMHTLKLSQVALAYGADDIDGTVSRYEIVQAAGGGAVAAGELERLIRQAGLTPVERNSFYRPRS